MFRRTFWFTAGAAAGVWATTKVNRKLRQLTPESLAAQAANRAVEAGHRLRDFAVDVRAGMTERELELGRALGIGDTAPPVPRRRAAIENTRRYLAGTSHEATAPREHDQHTRPDEYGPYDKPSGYADRPAHPHNRNEDH